MLRTVFWWDEKNPRGDADTATAGQLTLLINNTTIWNCIQWNWCDLLDFLCNNWNKIQNEGTPAESASESLKYDFNVSHDLAYAMRGASPPPSILFSRKGLQVQIITGTTTFTVDTMLLMKDLTQMGNYVASRLTTLADEKSKNLLERWASLTGFRPKTDVSAKIPRRDDGIAQLNKSKRPIWERGWPRPGR